MSAAQQLLKFNCSVLVFLFVFLQLEGNDRLSFLCEVDVGQAVPSSWLEALKLLRGTYANSLVISALAEVLKKDILIVTVHGVEYLGIILGNNYFGENSFDLPSCPLDSFFEQEECREQI